MVAEPVERGGADPDVTAFGSLYYTDCRPGQGLLGGAGFQFQAASAEVPAPAAALVQRAALYEPPVPWMRTRRPVADYPLSLAHCADGEVYATAAGRYLGVEANGTREGNQFTHAVVTDRAESYGLVRPAQLWDASWWAAGPAPTTAIDTVPAPPQPGRWTADAVRDRVAAAPGAADLLAALVSALQRLAGPGRAPVLVVAADAADAACWLSAATLLLPRARALRVSFKIFAADARGGRHDVVVLHPEWAGNVVDHRDTDSGRIVFDLVGHRHAAVDVTDSARFWTERFLAADPYDVADAVERAAAFAAARRAAAPGSAAPAEEGDNGGTGDTGDAAGPAAGPATGPDDPSDLPDSAEDRLAAAVLHLGEPVRSPRRAQALAQWLTRVAGATDARDVRRIADAVLDAAPHDVHVLRHLYGVLAGRTAPEIVARVAVGVLRAEVGEVLDAPARAGVDLVAGYPPVPADAPVGDMTAVLAAELGRARPDQVPGLLSLAARHRLRPTPPRDALHAFARWWVDHPGAVDHQPTWGLAAEVLDLVRAVLDERFRGRRDTASLERAVERHWTTLLWPTVVYPGDPLDRCLCGIAYRDAPAPARPDLLRRVLDRSTTDHGEAGAVAYSALFAHRPPDLHLDEVLDLTTELQERGLPLGPGLGAAVAAAVERLRNSPTAVSLRLLDRVAAAGHPLPPDLRRWHDHDLLLTAALASPDPGGAELGQVDERLLRIRGDDVLSAVLDRPAQDVLELVEDLPPASRAAVLDLLRTRWPQLGAAPDSVASARALAIAFFVVDGVDPVLAPDRGRLRPALGTIAAHLPRRGRQAVDRAYDPARLGEPWWNWLREVDGGGAAGVLGRARSMFGRKG